MSAPERVVIGEAELWRGDAREIVPTLGPVDAVITDPEYQITARGGGMAARRQYLHHIHGHLDGGFDFRILTPYRNWCVFCGKHQLVPLIQYAQSQRLRWQLLTWNKTNPTPLSHGNYLPDTEYLIHAFLSHTWESKQRFIVGPVEKNPFAHPTAKPLYVMHKVLKSTSQCGDRILDPFAGTCTTAVAALQLGRRFVGCEIDARYFAIGCRRVEAAYAQLALFPPLAPSVAPTQGMLFAARTGRVG